MLVGMFDGMRPDRHTGDAAEVNRQLQELVKDSKFAMDIAPRALTDTDITAIRRLRNSLLDRWTGIKPGDALELEFART